MDHLQEDKYVHQAYTELNPMTGLYYNRAFFKKADEYLEDVEPRTYSLIAVDIEHFRLFNKLYGRDAGDDLLVYIAGCIKNIERDYGGIAGYLGADNFCLLMPDQFGLVRELKYAIIKGVKQWSNTVGFLPAIGVYAIDDPAVPAMVMYDRATIALSHVLGNYTKRIKRYDAGMEAKIEEELGILTDIQDALEMEEFTFYAQPQCDISTGKIVGAESLVRWNHRTKGLISPGIFIPVLEKNGFIADLDRYVWRKVCEWLRSWIDRGHQPVPISINVSRLDIFSMDVPVYLTELVEKYDLPPKLLKVEVTESAYAESNDKIIKAVRDLRLAGFLVMMDDFGSGYSSLNMLKDVAVDVIKLDMRFLDMGEQDEEKGISIIQSIINMTRRMGLPIIVEGVETKKQESILRNLGCRYTQGYYYYKPLPIDQFETLLSDEHKIDYEGIWCKQVEGLHVREFLEDNLFTDTMVNNILGAAAFYDMYENQISVSRVNEQYYQLAGVSSELEKDYSQKFWNHVRDDDRVLLYNMFEQAYENQEEGDQGYIHFMRGDGQVLWVYMRVFYLREKDGHRLFYSSLVDMTEAKETERRSRASAYEVKALTDEQFAHMEKYYGELPCGYSVIRILQDEKGNPYDFELLFANRELIHMAGGKAQRLHVLAKTMLGDSQTELLEKAYRAAFLGETLDHYVYVSFSNRYLQITFYQYELGYVGCIFRDATHAHIYEDAMKGVMQSYREVYFLHLQDNYCRMIYPDENNMLERGNYEELVNRHFGTGKIVKHDEECVRQFLSLENLRNVLRTQDTVEYKYRRSAPGVVDEWCLVSFTVSERKKGVPKTAIVMIRSIENLMREEEERRRQHMAESLANMSDGFFIYRATDDEKILYANPPVLDIFGCDTMDEFRQLVGNSFQGMVHPEDLNRVKWEINEQIEFSDTNMDYTRYRIIRKDGEVRWLDDWGHLVDSGSKEDSQLFYVFISDITDTITAQQKEKILEMNKYY